MRQRRMKKYRLADNGHCVSCNGAIVITERMLKNSLYICKICANRRSTASKKTTKGRASEAAYRRSWRKNNLSSVLSYNKQYLLNNPQKGAAHRMVRYALSAGELKREPCVICGSAKTHGHHDNYARPLDVVWLCALHHAERHQSLTREYA